MKYFKPPFTLEYADRQYKALAKVLHPDKGGDKAEFQSLQQEYELVKKVCNSIEKRPVQKRGTKRILRRPPAQARNASPMNFLVVDTDKLGDLIEALTDGILKKRKK